MKLKNTLSLLLVIALVASLGIVAIAEDLPEVTLKITVPGDRPADTEDLMAAIEEACDLNVKLNFVFYANADISEKTRLSLASGEDNDLIWHPGRVDYVFAVENGYFEPLDELLDAYGQDLLANRPVTMWENCRIDGQLYAIPMGVYNRIGRHFNVREDLRKELGFEPINSIDGLIEFAYAIKENYPELAPITPGSYGGEQYTSWATFLFDGFADRDYIHTTDVQRGSLMLYFKNNDGIVYNLFDTEEPIIFEAIDQARQLYNDGIIYSDVLSLTTYRDQIALNKAAIIPFPEIIPESSQRNQLAANVAGGLIESVVWNEELFNTQGTMTANFKAWNHQSVAVVCKNKERAIQFLNWTQNKENYDLSAYGVPGVHVELVGDNKFNNISAGMRNFGYAWVWSPTFDRVSSLATDAEFTMDNWLRNGPVDDFLLAKNAPLLFKPGNVQDELAQYAAIESQFYAPIFNGVVERADVWDDFKAQAYDLTKVLQAELQAQMDELYAE